MSKVVEFLTATVADDDESAMFDLHAWRLKTSAAELIETARALDAKISPAYRSVMRELYGGTSSEAAGKMLDALARGQP